MGKTYFIIAAILLITQMAHHALAGQVTPLCSNVVKEDNTLVIPIKVVGSKGEMITAWGFDIDLKGLEYMGWNKDGCLAEKSASFMCNQLSNGHVRCGSYTGELNIDGEHTLFKLKLKKVPDTKESNIKLINFVDHLNGSKSTECELKQ